MDFKKELKRNKIDSILITYPQNVFYLTGYRGFLSEEKDAKILIWPQASGSAPYGYDVYRLQDAGGDPRATGCQVTQRRGSAGPLSAGCQNKRTPPASFFVRRILLGQAGF